MSNLTTFRPGMSEQVADQLSRVINKLDLMDLRARDFELSASKGLAELRVELSHLQHSISRMHTRTDSIEQRLQVLEGRTLEVESRSVPNRKGTLVAAGAGTGGAGVLYLIIEAIKRLL